jgi:hypothetical protein
MAIVTPHIDGKSLATLVEAFEQASGYIDPAGGYGGLIPAYFGYGPFQDYFTGNNLPEYFRDLDGIYLLACNCGEVGCWPLIASVRHPDETFVWERFSQPHRPNRDYSAFGPFEFSRPHYLAALRELALRIGDAR